MKPLIKNILSLRISYDLYIHPFELSKAKMPKVPDTGILASIIARTGFGKVDGKIETLIGILTDVDYRVTTFGELRGGISSLMRDEYGCY